MASAPVLDHRLAVPDDDTVAKAAEAVDILGRFLRDPAPLTATTLLLTAKGEDPTTIELPAPALHLLADILVQIANGHAVTVAPVHAELTTQQAADLMNVSRPYLVGLLEARKIPHRRVGNRRRVLLTDLLEYKRRDDTDRLAVASELAAEAQRLGFDY
ncbi:helix-turn-helix domain-containing protein [Candidatus Poriferisocius sp.]|uniref:helix-turn-helix domain-containing protein n=1 Tax=Candidatus Poriferisocius sp. TaxID=3101276 RepID=UPI003B594124